MLINAVYISLHNQSSPMFIEIGAEKIVLKILIVSLATVNVIKVIRSLEEDVSVQLKSYQN